jgi:hypothetical protein
MLIGASKMDQLKQKIETAVSESQYDAVLALGVDNYNYLSRTVLPFAENYPSRKAAVLMPKDTFLITEEGNKLIGWWKD